MPDSQGLMSLLTAMQSGLDPATGYGMMQDIQAQQEAEQAQRMDRQSGLLGMLQEVAMGGMPFAGAEALLNAAPGPMGPALQQGLDALYGDSSGAPAPIQTAGPNGQELGYQEPSGLAPLPTTTSPAFVPPEPSPTEMLAVQEAQVDAQSAADWAKVQQQLGAAKAANKPLDAVLAAMTGNPAYAAVIGQDPGQFQKMIEITYGPSALAMMGIQ